MTRMTEKEMIEVSGGKKWYAICDCGKTYSAYTWLGLMANVGLALHKNVCGTCSINNKKGIGYFVTVKR